jgi:tRNA(Ile)-lysidine synthase
VNKEITLVRPLLGVTKNELRTFAQENQITFREDSTNARLDRPRNRVRNELLPLLRRHYQPALTRMILRLMKIVGADSEVVGKVARGWLKTGRADLLVGQEARQRIATVFSYDELPVAVQRRVLQRQLKELGVWADFELVERLRCEPETLFGVSTGISVTRDVAGMISLRTPTTAGFKVNELTFELVGGAGEVDFEGIGIQWNIENAKAAITLGRTAGCESFDAAKVGGQITLRHWRAGDRFQPIGLKSAAKLQDLFTNQKIPRARRHNLVVAEAANGEIFWVQNLRMSEPFKLTPATKRRLVWRWRCGSA